MVLAMRMAGGAAVSAAERPRPEGPPPVPEEDPGPVSDAEMRRYIAALGPFGHFHTNQTYLNADYLAPFARSFWSAAAGSSVPWPAGEVPLMQILARQLQLAGLRPGSKTLITMPRTAGRALMTMSLLAAWRMQHGDARQLLFAARTERLARAFRARHQSVLDVPLLAMRRENRKVRRDEEDQLPLSTARWMRVGGRPRREALSDLVICDPLATRDYETAAARRELIAWIDAVRTAGQWEDGAMASTVLLVETKEGSDLPGRLVREGWQHVDIPRRTHVPLSFEISRVKTIDIPAGRLLVPLPLAVSVAHRLREEGFTPAEIEAVLT